MTTVGREMGLRPRHPVADGLLACLTGSAVGERDEEVHWPATGLSFRAMKAMHRSGCKTPRELAAYGRARLLNLRDTGGATVSEIAGFLRERYGLTLAP